MTNHTFQHRIGIFVFCNDFHTGYTSREYRIMCKLDAELPDRVWKAIRCSKCDPDGEWTIARETYKRLKEKLLCPKR